LSVELGDSLALQCNRTLHPGIGPAFAKTENSFAASNTLFTIEDKKIDSTATGSYDAASGALLQRNNLRPKAAQDSNFWAFAFDQTASRVVSLVLDYPKIQDAGAVSLALDSPGWCSDYAAIVGAGAFDAQNRVLYQPVEPRSGAGNQTLGPLSLDLARNRSAVIATDMAYGGPAGSWFGSTTFAWPRLIRARGGTGQCLPRACRNGRLPSTAWSCLRRRCLAVTVGAAALRAWWWVWSRLIPCGRRRASCTLGTWLPGRPARARGTSPSPCCTRWYQRYMAGDGRQEVRSQKELPEGPLGSPRGRLSARSRPGRHIATTSIRAAWNLRRAKCCCLPACCRSAECVQFQR
jgi:hypothetical protein